MISFTNENFRKCFAELPESVKTEARKVYKIWKDNPFHKSLQFKKVHSEEEIWSVRVGKHWRALCLKKGEEVTWFWIGSHSEYDKLLSKF